nr:MAG TPA: hypothetical protein [Caudoviricetes sp.]
MHQTIRDSCEILFPCILYEIIIYWNKIVKIKLK